MQGYLQHQRQNFFDIISDGRSQRGLLAASARDEQSSADKGTSLDLDQKVSAELGPSLSPLLAISEPPELPSLMGSPSLASPALDGPPDICSSPAALFLSAFSPSVSERPLVPDDEGALVAGYTLGPIVGHGGFSIIRTASSSHGAIVAVKIVRYSDLHKQPDAALARKSLAREAQAWASLNHEHILPLFTVSHTPHADFFFTAYCPAGSLFDILKRDGRPALPQDDAGMMFRQVVRGLRYMHEVAGYVHGDLKLENVLVDEMGVCKIGDFGMARKIGETDDLVESDEEDGQFERQRQLKAEGPHRSRTISQAQVPALRSLGRHKGKLPQHLSLRRHGVSTRHRTSSPYPDSTTDSLPNRCFAPGSLPYAAPELLLSPTNTKPYIANSAQDIWALGVMLFALLTGKLPFSDSFEPRLQMKILHGVFEMPQGIGRSAEQALRGCMDRSVPNRWTVAMVDDVAWGIGWGSAADDVTPPSEAIVSRSRSRSRVQTRQEHALDDEDSGRSVSRPARSSSRSTFARSCSRSKSRPPPHCDDNAPSIHPLLQTRTHRVHPLASQPSLSSLTNAILRTTSTASSDSGTQESVIIFQPSLSNAPDMDLERGRAPRNRLQTEPSESVSRSRSPHEMPATPKDLPLDAALNHRKSPPRGPLLTSPELGLTLSELETLDEDERWALSPDADPDMDPSSVGARGRGRAFSRVRDELRKALRNESMPPALSPGQASPWMVPLTPQGALSRYASGSVTGFAAPATPIPIPGAKQKQSLRSKSLDGHTPRERRHRPLVSSAWHGE